MSEVFTLTSMIRQNQLFLDSNLKTVVEITARKHFFGVKTPSKKSTGSFYIKMSGDYFKDIAIQSYCECITTKYAMTSAKPQDSLKVNYEINRKN